MKRLKHRFNKDVLRGAWKDYQICNWCDTWGANCFHHIISPSSLRYKAGSHNSSIFNSSPLHNHKCHLYNGKLHHEGSEGMLLIKTMHYLMSHGYKPNAKDAEFYMIYKWLYNKYNGKHRKKVDRQAKD